MLTYQDLKKTHSDYDRDECIRLWSLYKGGKVFRKNVNMFLPQNPDETSDVYENRKKESSYRSYIGPIVDYFVQWLFSGGFTMKAKDSKSKKPIEGISSIYTDFQSDCGNDVSFHSFLRDRTTVAMVKGKSHWLLQKPKADFDPKSEQEAEDAGLTRPTAVPIEEENVLDFMKDEHGAYEWVCIYSRKELRAAPGQPTIIRQQWHVIDRENTTIYSIDRKPGEENLKDGDPIPCIQPAVAHGFKEVPLVTLTMPDGLWIANRVAEPQTEHFRLSAALGWAIRRTCYAMPIFNIEDGENTVPKMGAGYYIQLGANDKFSWSTPQSTPYDIIGKQVDAQRDEIYRITHQMAQGLDNNADTVGRSADSKEFDEASTKVMLTAYGKLISEVVEESFEIISDANGDERMTWDIDGFTGYDVATLSRLIANALQIKAFGIASKTFAQQVQTKLALAVIPEANEEVKNLVREEIVKGAIELLPDVSIQSAADSRSMSILT